MEYNSENGPVLALVTFILLRGLSNDHLGYIATLFSSLELSMKKNHQVPINCQLCSDYSGGPLPIINMGEDMLTVRP